MAKWTTHPDLIELKNGDLKVRILDEIWVDYDLPKYKTKELETDVPEVRDGMVTQEMVHRDYESVNDSGMIGYNNRHNEERAGRFALSDERKAKKLPWYKHIFMRKPMDVDDTFTGIKERKVILTEEMKEQLEKLQKAVDKANIMGQKYLAEQLRGASKWIVYEATLAKSGFPYAIEEDTIVEFFKKCSRGIAIDYLKFYTAFIPDEVAEKKRQADELMIFDNYCIMHYDDNNNNIRLTESQKRRARDPIVFGMIRGSRKLYYIADWVTKEDDLTLENFFKTLSPEDVEQQKDMARLSNDIQEIAEGLSLIGRVD